MMTFFRNLVIRFREYRLISQFGPMQNFLWEGSTMFVVRNRSTSPCRRIDRFFRCSLSLRAALNYEEARGKILGYLPTARLALLCPRATADQRHSSPGSGPGGPIITIKSRLGRVQIVTAFCLYTSLDIVSCTVRCGYRLCRCVDQIKTTCGGINFVVEFRTGQYSFVTNGFQRIFASSAQDLCQTRGLFLQIVLMRLYRPSMPSWCRGLAVIGQT